VGLNKLGAYIGVLDCALICMLTAYTTLNEEGLENKFNIKNNINYEFANSKNNIESVINMDNVFDEFENKKIPVLMFHNFGERENRYTISPDNFRKLLKDLYINDFYSVSLEEFYKGDFSDVPVGKKPVLLTFDDAGPGQFILKNDGSICENSAVGIMNEFYEVHDFGKPGVSFHSFGTRNDFRLPYMQDDLASEKMKMLLDMGYGLGYHTVNHPDNTNASKNNVFEQYKISTALFKYMLGDDFDKQKIKSYAHPFGAVPQNSQVFNYMTEFYDVIFDAWGGQSSHPLSNNFNPHRVPRIEITYHTLGSVINRKDNYVVTPDTKQYYALINNKFERSEPLKELKPLYADNVKTNNVPASADKSHPLRNLLYLFQLRP
jgi:peptidoglycan/xylan/chitin deacetylase (PgdA/CDA1 family)